MTIRHVFSNAVGDWTGTVTVHDSQASTVTAVATAIVRPTDWNSVHNEFLTLSGNTAGVSTLSGTNIIIAGGSNITLSGNGQTVSIVGGAGTASGLSNIKVSAGTTSNLLSDITFADSNGVSFGLNASTITASHNGLTSQSNQNVTAGNGGFAFQTLSFSNANGVSFSTSAGSAIVASHNGLTSQSNQNVTAANGGFAFQTLSFSNLNGISFGTSAGSAITASHNALTTQSGQAFSAAGGTSTFETLSFRNANGISFSNSNGSVEASYTVPTVPAQISVGDSNLGNTAGDTAVVTGRMVLVGSNNITLSGSSNAGSLTISIIGAAAGAGGLAVGDSNLGNTAGDTGVFTGRVVFVGHDNITLSGSSNAGSATISVIGAAAGTASGITNIRISAGTTANLGSAFSFADSNGVSFGINASTITASHNGITTQTNQTLGAYFVGNTTGQSSSSTYDARTLSIDGAGIVSAGWSNGSIRISATQSNQNVTANNGGFAFQTLSFSDLNGISFGTSAGSAITASHNALTSQSNQNVTAGNGGFAFQTLSFSNVNGISFGTSAGSAITASHNAITSESNQTGGIYALGNTTGQSSSSTYDARTLSIEGAGFISVGWSNGSFRISGTQTNPVVSNAIASVGSATNSGTNTSCFAADDHVHAGVFSVGVSNVGNTSGDTRVDVGRFVLAGGNNITLSQGTAAGALNTITISAAAAVAQTNQTAGVYFVGNTTGQSSSSTYDARTLSIDGAGIVSAGWSNSTIRISATQSNQNVTAGNGGFAFQTLSFSNLNGISFGTSAGSAITASHNGITAESNQTLGLYAVSNTTGASSSSTFDARTISFQGAGIASVGFSNGSVVVSVPAGGGAGDGGVFAGVSTGGNTAGSTGTVSTGNFVLVGSNAISLSQSTAAAGSHATITINAPATSSLVGTSGISISTAGSTISVMASPVSFNYFSPYDEGADVSQVVGNGSFLVQPLVFPDVVHDRVGIRFCHSNASNSSGSHTYSFLFGVYTKNVSTLSLLTSTSTSAVHSFSGTAGSASLFMGNRLVTIPWTQTRTSGDYWVGVGCSYSTSSTNNTIMSFIHNLRASGASGGFSGIFGAASNATNQRVLGQGRFTAATAAVPGSIAFSDIQGGSTSTQHQNPVKFIFASGTV